MTATNISAPVNDIAQERNLVTAIPGPKSVAMQARRLSAVSGGVGAALPIYIERAAGGIVVDIDGNSLIDMGSGIAVTGVGNAAEDVVTRVQEQVARFTQTCFRLCRSM